MAVETKQTVMAKNIAMSSAACSGSVFGLNDAQLGKHTQSASTNNG